jgi:hypothetical protein
MCEICICNLNKEEKTECKDNIKLDLKETGCKLMEGVK